MSKFFGNKIGVVQFATNINLNLRKDYILTITIK